MSRVFKDFIGRPVQEGDYIFYSTTSRYAESRLCQITRFTPKTVFAKSIKGNRTNSHGSASKDKDFAVQNSFIKVDEKAVEAYLAERENA